MRKMSRRERIAEEGGGRHIRSRTIQRRKRR